ncbi:MAG: hypothetical protein ACI4DK_11200 [Lachnospiraceae bacterium]
MFEYDEASQKAAEKLDNYDLTNILSWCYDASWRDPWDIKQKIQIEYPELDDILDDLSSDEFMEYLSKKYNVRFEEIISYRMWYVPKR